MMSYKTGTNDSEMSEAHPEHPGTPSEPAMSNPSPVPSPNATQITPNAELSPSPPVEKPSQPGASFSGQYDRQSSTPGTSGISPPAPSSSPPESSGDEFHLQSHHNRVGLGNQKTKSFNRTFFFFFFFLFSILVCFANVKLADLILGFVLFHQFSNFPKAVC